MKIRTDFVTNSSSSSFCVNITVKTAKGKKFSTSINPEDAGGDGNANLNCTGEDILQASDIQALMELLAASVQIVYPSEDESYFKQRVLDLFERVGKEVSDLSEIDRIILKRTWEAWGEGASGFPWNLEYYAKELPMLARQVVESSGEEKETAKKKLEKYLKEYDGHIDSESGGEFPSGFMGTKGNASIDWKSNTKDIEVFAKKIVSGDLRNEDYAEETVTVDLRKKTITNTAKYIV